MLLVFVVLYIANIRGYSFWRSKCFCFCFYASCATIIVVEEMWSRVKTARLCVCAHVVPFNQGLPKSALFPLLLFAYHCYALFSSPKLARVWLRESKTHPLMLKVLRFLGTRKCTIFKGIDK